jgi:hypothetical protein
VAPVRAATPGPPSNFVDSLRMIDDDKLACRGFTKNNAPMRTDASEKRRTNKAKPAFYY